MNKNIPKSYLALYRNQNSALKQATFQLGLSKVGAVAGGIKGALDQPNTYILDPNTNELKRKKYNPIERVGYVGLNAGIGTGVGLLGDYYGTKLKGTIQSKLHLADQYLNKKGYSKFL